MRIRYQCLIRNTQKMMKKEWLCAAGIVCLMAACGGVPQSSADGLNSVDVEGAMEKQTELKLSELGSDVRYVSLETNDSCLIGGNPSITLLDKHILVSSRKDCFVFDKETGKFLSKVGHTGDDPKAYSDATPTYNDKNGLLYFKRYPDKLQKYDLQGNYRGSVTMPTPPEAPADFCFTDTYIVGRYGDLVGSNPRSLLLFNEAGEQIDTVPSILPLLPNKGIDEISSISVKRQGNAGIILALFSNGDATATIAGIPVLWKSDNQVRYKENFIDTIYTVSKNALEPYLVFSTGKWHWGAEARTDSKDNEKRLLVACVFETDDTFFFQCIRGLYTDKPETFNGIYDRNVKTTRMNAEEKGLTDDLTGFMPFHPKTCSMQGEYGMIVEAGKVVEWLEENPEAADNDKLATLKELTDDSNPLVVITVPK